MKIKEKDFVYNYYDNLTVRFAYDVAYNNLISIILALYHLNNYAFYKRDSPKHICNKKTTFSIIKLIMYNFNLLLLKG